MSPKLIFKKQKESLVEPSEFWKRTQSLATQIFGFSLWTPRLSSWNPKQNLTELFKTWIWNQGLAIQVFGLGLFRKI